MNSQKTNYITKIGMLAAIAFILQYIGTIMGIKVSGFLDVEFSDLPAIIGALALGPVAGVLVELVKNLLHCLMTTTGYVGELANFVINGVFVFTIGLIYKYHKTKKGAMLSLLLGTIAVAVAGMLANYFVMLPLYMPDADFQTKFNLIMFTITPFNIGKGIVLSIITILCYKRLSPILHK